jgi:tripartite-type tricarboxylate transporter receptor subunit TctC
MIVPFPPGGPVDSTARIFGQKLGRDVEGPVVIDNRAGAGGVIGASIAAKEAPTATACSWARSITRSIRR